MADAGWACEEIDLQKYFSPNPVLSISKFSTAKYFAPNPFIHCKVKWIFHRRKSLREKWWWQINIFHPEIFQDIPGIQGVDTRALTKLIREKVGEAINTNSLKIKTCQRKQNHCAREQCWASCWWRGTVLTCLGSTRTPSTWWPRSPSRWSMIAASPSSSSPSSPPFLGGAGL